MDERVNLIMQFLAASLSALMGSGLLAALPGVTMESFTDAPCTGQPPANPQLLAERTINIPALPVHGWLEVMIPSREPG